MTHSSLSLNNFTMMLTKTKKQFLTHTLSLERVSGLLSQVKILIEDVEFKSVKSLIK